MFSTFANATTALIAVAAAVSPAAPKEDFGAFVAERQAWCQKFKDAPLSERDAIFARYSERVKKRNYALSDVQATVMEVQRSRGTGRLMLTVSAPFGECSNAHVWEHHIVPGTELHAAARDVGEGDAVVVSLANVKPFHNHLQPLESICGTDWLVQYTKVERPKR